MNLLQLLTIISVEIVFPAAPNEIKDTHRALVRKRQSAYICGVEPYRFYSDIPCTYYPMCVNGGMMVNVGCSSDTTCRLYNANWVCVQGCCCTIPRLYTPTSFYPTISAAPTVSSNKFFSWYTVFFVYLLRIFVANY